MASVWFILATFDLFLTTANSQPQSWSKPIYNNQAKIVLDVLWKTFNTEFRNRESVLIFTTPALMDVVYVIYKSMDNETKRQVSSELPSLETSDTNTVLEALPLLYDMRIRTTFYGKTEAVTRRLSYGLLFYPILLPSNSFKPAVHYAYELPNFNGDSCPGRYCPLREVLESKPDFATITLTNFNVSYLPGFQWLAEVQFALSDTSSVSAVVARGFGYYDHAEFKYPRLNGCTGRVFRLPYGATLNIFFVIPSAESMCGSSEDLWMNIRNVSLNELSYQYHYMFVSIPLFVASTNIDLRSKLKRTPFAQAFDKQSSIFYNAKAFQTAEFTFHPLDLQFSPSPPTAPTEGGVRSFRAERPFFFALVHYMGQLPIVAGLINNPQCGRNCDRNNNT